MFEFNPDMYSISRKRIIPVRRAKPAIKLVDGARMAQNNYLIIRIKTPPAAGDTELENKG